jgi:hypothetical protein
MLNATKHSAKIADWLGVRFRKSATFRKLLGMPATFCGQLIDPEHYGRPLPGENEHDDEDDSPISESAEWMLVKQL